MIEKILNKLGYFKGKDIESAYLQSIGDVSEYSILPKEEKILFDKLKGLDGFQEYLRATIAKDVQRYFMASSESQRDIIKGGFARTLYLKSKTSGIKENKETTKLPNLRYG